MLDKVKKTYEEHKDLVWMAGKALAFPVTVTALILLGKKFAEKNFSIPTVTKEVAIKFLEERGTQYQVDIIDEALSVVWISKD